MSDQPDFDRLFYCLQHEVMGAEAKFPGNEDNLAALQEEVGELAKALLEHKYGSESNYAVFAEAIQVAAMALKIARNGDKSFPYHYTHACYRYFQPTGSNTGSNPGMESGLYAKVPESCSRLPGYLSPGKLYKVIDQDDGMFTIIDDDGEEITPRWNKSVHINKMDWEPVNIP